MIWRRRDDVVQQITVESPSERLRLCHDRSDYRFQTALSKSFLSSDSTIPSTLVHDGCYQREIKNQYPMFIFITFARRRCRRQVEPLWFVVIDIGWTPHTSVQEERARNWCWLAVVCKQNKANLMCGVGSLTVVAQSRLRRARVKCANCDGWRAAHFTNFFSLIVQALPRYPLVSLLQFICYGFRTYIETLSSTDWVTRSCLSTAQEVINVA